MIHSKISPYNIKQSGGDTVSQGGTTSATTAIGNHDLSQENRSGHSGHDNFHNISGGGNAHHQHSGSANGFGGDQSHKSISDRERTPTNQDNHYQPTSWREDGAQTKQNALLNDKVANKSKEAGETDGDGKQKDPYYFTFFNEKNETNKGDVGQNTQPRR